MKTTIHNRALIFRATALFGLLAALIICFSPAQTLAQNFPRGVVMPPNFHGSPPPSSSSGSSPSSPGSPGKDAGPWIPSTPLSDNTSTNQDAGTNGIQLSFQGANIDMVVQWLSQTTGKSVLKHPQVHCQLTITSSKKVSPREAINLVYRALSLEGYSAIEFSDSILIVPQDKEPKMNPEMLSGSETNVPEGRQMLVKVFSLKHIQASDLKERIGMALSDKATVYLDEQANQIIITDYNDNIRAVGDLIAMLDTDKPEDVTVRVISLNHVSAADLVKEIGPLYQKKNGKSLKDSVELAADDQSNTILVLSSESSFKSIKQFISALDTEEAQEKIMRTFTLKNADAQDVAKQLQDLNQEQSITARYIYNYGSSSSGKDSKKMTVVADRRRNAVIIQAPPGQMESLARMIDELDAPVSNENLAPRIYPMQYASAPDIEDVLNELFLKKQQQRSYWDYYYFDDTSSSTPDRDVGRLYGKVRITSEPNANVLIVTANSKENLAAVEDIIKQLDKPSEAGESTLHVGLKFAKAIDVANNINIIFARNGSPPLRAVAQQNPQNNGYAQQAQQQQSGSSASTGFDLGVETKIDGYFPWLGGQVDNSRSSNNRDSRPVSDLVGRVRAVADERSNALIVSANVHYFPQILKLLEELDAPTDQVLIEARLVEVSSDFLDQLGVRWSPDGSQVFTANDLDNSLIANVNSKYRTGYGGTTSVNTPSSDVVAQALTSLRSGVLSSSISMDFLVQFLHKTTGANVMASPQLNIRDNETGKLFVGQQVPVPNTTQVSSAGSQNTTITYKDVGVVLEVTPHINIDGDVELKIHAESSTTVPGQTVLGGAVFETRNFRTDLTARNGQTLVVGGIIQKQTSKIERKTPFFGSIPGLKWLFNNKDDNTHEVELMVFLRPKVIRTPRDAKEALDEVKKNTPLIQGWQDEMNPAPKGKKQNSKRKS